MSGDNNNNKPADQAPASMGANVVLRLQALAALVLLVGVVSSALAVAFVAQTNRALFNELEAARREQASLQAEWSRLLLERGALSAHSRVERIARDKLGMRYPRPAETVVVP